MWIYVVRNTINDKLYVGQTERINPNERWREHLECVKGRRRQRLYSSIRSHGIEKFEFTPWEQHLTLDDLDDAEQFWIAFFRSWDEAFGYNQTMGGQWGRLTPDGRHHLSEINRGEKNPFYGKHHTEKAKRAISVALKGNQYGKGVISSEEKKEKQRQSMKKVWTDPEYKERLRRSHQNRTWSLSESGKRSISLSTSQKNVALRGEKGRNSKLTEENVRQILISLENDASGSAMNKLSKQFNVSLRLIQGIKAKKCPAWQHLFGENNG